MNQIDPDERGLILTCPNCQQRNRVVYERSGDPFRCSKCQRVLKPAAGIQLGSYVEAEGKALFELTKLAIAGNFASNDSPLRDQR